MKYLAWLPAVSWVLAVIFIFSYGRLPGAYSLFQLFFAVAVISSLIMSVYLIFSTAQMSDDGLKLAAIIFSVIQIITLIITFTNITAGFACMAVSFFQGWVAAHHIAKNTPKEVKPEEIDQ